MILLDSFITFILMPLCVWYCIELIGTVKKFDTVVGSRNMIPLMRMKVIRTALFYGSILEHLYKYAGFPRPGVSENSIQQVK